MVMTGAAVSLRYSPGATVMSTTSPFIGERTVISHSCVWTSTPNSLEPPVHIVLGRPRLLQGRSRLGEGRFGRHDFLLRDRAIGEQIADTADVGFRFRHGGLAVCDVGLRLA